MRKRFKVRLYGKLAETYSSDWIEVYATSTCDIFAGLCSRFGHTFKSTIINGSWYITSGNRKTNKLSDDDTYITSNQVQLPCIAEEVHIFPEISGSGNILKIVIGVVLVVVGAYTGNVGLVVAGLGLVLGGVQGLLSSPPKIDDYSGANQDERKSFIFNGATNTSEQGVPVQLVYGIHPAGSIVISAGLDVEQIIPLT